MIKERYRCTRFPHKHISNLDLPQQYCGFTNCKLCITALKTVIITDSKQLITPEHIIIRNSVASEAESTEFFCLQNKNDHCDCTHQSCTGTQDFCAVFPCVDTASCSCNVTTVSYERVFVTDESTYLNPNLLTFHTCLFKLPTNPSRKVRHLLANEDAAFTKNNVSVQFTDPVIKVSTAGTLIVRTSLYEHIFHISDALTVTLPWELLAFKQTLTIVFISHTGFTLSGKVNLEGKRLCRYSNCIICLDFLRQTQCWPQQFSYPFYTVLTIITFVCIYCSLKILKIIFKLVYFTVHILHAVFRLTRAVLRGSLIAGAILGHNIRRAQNHLGDILEVNDVRLRHLPLAVLALCLVIIPSTSADCSTQAVIQSKIRNCKFTNVGDTQCAVASSAEITLKGIDHEACLWFTDDSNRNLFEIKLRLKNVHCSFDTVRKYFTFPVKLQTLSQLSCPQNAFCSWGTHCHENANFESLTDESLDYPGFQACHPSSVGSGCTIVSRQACLFFRAYFIPELLESYEVRQITGHSCSYDLVVEEVQNSTVQVLTVKQSAVTANGIAIEVLGSLDQPALHLSEDLIQRVGNPEESYLAPSSSTNTPQAGLVGQIQANSSFTKSFIFDKNIVSCFFFETTLRCSLLPDVLQSLAETKDKALPITRSLHYLYMQDGVLQSRLLHTAPVKVMLHFTDYHLTIMTKNVCPKFAETPAEVQGCYACPLLAQISFTAFSTCHDGVVDVELQTISIHTRTVLLHTTSGTISIQFMASVQCYNEKLCLVSQNMRTCKLLKFCLREPSIELKQFNSSYTQISAASTSNFSWWSYFTLPSSGTLLLTVKLLGGALLVICLFITIISSCITCCKSR